MNETAQALTPSEELSGYDFGGAQFDLENEDDRQILCFVLSQALYGEATGVYCGKSLYAAHSLEAAQFYVRQAKQELGHLKLFADILRALDLKPIAGHWMLRLFSSHNNYYPLKVLLEHAVGEGMVLDIFKDVLLQTLPDSDPRVPALKKKLRVICREEAEHVAWGEKETVRILKEKPHLKSAFFGLVKIQLALLPLLVGKLAASHSGHPVLSQLPQFIEHVRAGVVEQGKRLGYFPEAEPSLLRKASAMTYGVGLYIRSQFTRPHAPLEKNYLRELGFTE